MGVVVGDGEGVRVEVVLGVGVLVGEEIEVTSFSGTSTDISDGEEALVDGGKTVDECVAGCAMAAKSPELVDGAEEGEGTTATREPLEPEIIQRTPAVRTNDPIAIRYFEPMDMILKHPSLRLARALPHRPDAP